MSIKSKVINDDILNDIESDNDWDNGKLGQDAQHAKVYSDTADTKLNLKLISCRLQETLIDDLKHISASKGISYQPLIRQVLTEYVSTHYSTKNKLA